MLGMNESEPFINVKPFTCQHAKSSPSAVFFLSYHVSFIDDKLGPKPEKNT